MEFDAYLPEECDCLANRKFVEDALDDVAASSAEVARRDFDVGDVAAPSATDEDFRAEFAGPVEDGDLQLRREAFGKDRGGQSGSAAANNDDTLPGMQFVGFPGDV